MGPAHATADPTGDQLTIYSNDMKSYGLRNGVAEFLKMPRDRVRVVWMDGPQAYGRTAADDAGFEAALLATEIKRPVRLQWMRDEETAWDTKGPAYAITMRGGLDATGQLVVLDYDARAADHNHLGYNEPDTVLVAQLTGQRKTTPARGRASVPSDVYAVPHRRQSTHVVSLPLVWETPLRTGNLRDPDGPQVTFASESFIDELAAAAKADPAAFRRRLLHRLDRGRQRLQARPVDRRARCHARRPTGGTPARRRRPRLGARSSPAAASPTPIAARPWPRRSSRSRSTGAPGTCGPSASSAPTTAAWSSTPRRCAARSSAGCCTRSAARCTRRCGSTPQKVTSVDWMTSPTLTHADTPERIDVVLVNGDPNPAREDLPHYGAGETVCKPMLAAVANAIFDATGVRLRRVPFRDARVLAALKAAGV